jgi:quinohemoprotein ethanol dehydrogenase
MAALKGTRIRTIGSAGEGPDASVAGLAGPVADGVNTINIGANNVEYSYGSARTRVKAGTAVTFTNINDIPHTATAFQKGNWNTGV